MFLKTMLKCFSMEAYILCFHPRLYCSLLSCSLMIQNDILQAGGNPNAATDYDGRTPLHIACTEGQVEIVKCLLLRGASPHVQDKYGQRPIDDAIQAENEQIVELLCDCGAHIGPMSMDSARLLCQYAADSKVSKLKVWHLAGADLNSGDYDKRTPLHVVSLSLKSLMAFLLVEESYHSLYISFVATMKQQRFLYFQ